MTHGSRPTTNDQRFPTNDQRLLAFTLCLLLGWATWARGGTQVGLQPPMVWIGGVIFGLLFLNRLANVCKTGWIFSRWTATSGRGQTPPGGRRPPGECGDCAEEPLRSWLRDPVIWAGLAFLALLTIQWWNAGRYPFFHPFDKRWIFTPPPHPGLPWAVDRNDAAEMLRWFFPAWVLMLAFRHTRQPAVLAKAVAWFLVVNAGILAAFGIVQQLSGTHNIFWITPLPEHFFASFGYDNHAASFFSLFFAFSSGLLLQELSLNLTRNSRNQDEEFEQNKDLNGITEVHDRRRVAIISAATCAVLCLVAMVLSLSRAGILLAVGLAGMMLLVAVRLFWGRISVAHRVTFVSASLMGAAVLFFTVSTLGGPALSREAHKVTTNLDTREFLIGSAAKIWSAEPWFGVGGWGFRHYVSVFVAEEPGRKLSLGYANTHNDFMQFLCEFGVIGFGLMLVALLAYAWPMIRQLRRPLSPGLVMAIAGLLAVLLHSQIDLPFRSPAILYSWLAVVGIVNRESLVVSR